MTYVLSRTAAVIQSGKNRKTTFGLSFSIAALLNGGALILRLARFALLSLTPSYGKPRKKHNKGQDSWQRYKG